MQPHFPDFWLKHKELTAADHIPEETHSDIEVSWTMSYRVDGSEHDSQTMIAYIDHLSQSCGHGLTAVDIQWDRFEWDQFSSSAARGSWLSNRSRRFARDSFQSIHIEKARYIFMWTKSAFKFF